MSRATQNDKKNKWKRIFISVIIGIFVIILCIGCIYLMRKKNGQNVENMYDIQQTIVPYEEEQYIEFENLFREHKDDMSLFVELSQECILGEINYLILFDENWYSSMQSGNPLGEYIIILFSNNTFVLEGEDEIAEALNKNDDLIGALNSINEKGVITSVDSFYLDETIQMIGFAVDPTFTPFITNNNGVENWFGYCVDKDCEVYGYKNIEDNWYMYISPQPE